MAIAASIVIEGFVDRFSEHFGVGRRMGRMTRNADVSSWSIAAMSFDEPRFSRIMAFDTDSFFRPKKKFFKLRTVGIVADQATGV
jgi:hypothetical protein